MNWPKELIIKRDATNTKVSNISDIISYISNCYDLGLVLEKVVILMELEIQIKFYKPVN